MSPAELLQMVRARSFTPFRIYLDDGAIYEIRHTRACDGQRGLRDHRFR